MKPCPFCGDGDIAVRRQDYNWFGANCNNCGAEGSYCDTKEEAIEAWDERVPQPELLKALEVAFDTLGSDSISQDRFDETYEIIYAAIAKAKE